MFIPRIRLLIAVSVQNQEANVAAGLGPGHLDRFARMNETEGHAMRHIGEGAVEIPAIQIDNNRGNVKVLSHRASGGAAGQHEYEKKPPQIAPKYSSFDS